MKHRTEITFEVEETIVLRIGEKTRNLYCPICRETTVMATAPIWAVLAGLTEREVFRLIEVGKVHILETDRVFVCMNSLPKQVRRIDT